MRDNCRHLKTNKITKLQKKPINIPLFPFQCVIISEKKNKRIEPQGERMIKRNYDPSEGH
jgi:hypothetical protein